MGKYGPGAAKGGGQRNPAVVPEGVRAKREKANSLQARPAWGRGII